MCFQTLNQIIVRECDCHIYAHCIYLGTNLMWESFSRVLVYTCMYILGICSTSSGDVCVMHTCTLLSD